MLAAVLLLAALAVGASSNGGLTLMEKDMLCLNRQFNDASFPQHSLTNDFCESIGFPTRWESMFPGVELGVGAGGLRALAFKSKTNAQHIAFAFRELLHDKKQFNMIDDDYWQIYSMQPPLSTTPLSLNRAMLLFRYYMGFDYVRHAQSFVDEVLGRGGGKRFPIFTGYGYGGSIAMLQALRIDQSFAITFSSPSNLRSLAVDIWQARSASKRITNLCFDKDGDDEMESSAINCKFKTPDMYAIMFDGNFNVTSRNVFSDYGFAAITPQQQRACRDPIL